MSLQPLPQSVDTGCMQYAYEATDMDGTLIAGQISARTEDEAQAQIRAEGLVPLTVVPDVIDPPRDNAPAVNEPAPSRQLQRRRWDSEDLFASPRNKTVENKKKASEQRSFRPRRNDLPVGGEPAPPPRNVDFMGTAYSYRNPLAMFAILWCTISGIMLIALVAGGQWFAALLPGSFVAFGIAIGSSGVKAAKKRLVAWREGVSAPATVVWIGKDTSYKVNGRSPFMMKYEFEANGLVHTGVRKSFNREIKRYDLGERIWVVYVPEDPTLSAEWPPIR